jgi:hypothetical protein
MKELLTVEISYINCDFRSRKLIFFMTNFSDDVSEKGKIMIITKLVLNLLK